ncbi:hypothetical protein D3C81_2088810 [compost metagenome]
MGTMSSCSRNRPVVISAVGSKAMRSLFATSAAVSIKPSVCMSTRGVPRPAWLNTG